MAAFPHCFIMLLKLNVSRNDHQLVVDKQCQLKYLSKSRKLLSWYEVPIYSKPFHAWLLLYPILLFGKTTNLSWKQSSILKDRSHTFSKADSGLEKQNTHPNFPQNH